MYLSEPFHEPIREKRAVASKSSASRKRAVESESAGV